MILGFGFVFGVDAADRNKYYQVHHINDRWPDPPADNVPGPHLKIKKRNGLDCLPEMDASNNCTFHVGRVFSIKDLSFFQAMTSSATSRP